MINLKNRPSYREQTAYSTVVKAIYARNAAAKRLFAFDTSPTFNKRMKSTFMQKRMFLLNRSEMGLFAR